MIRALPGYLDIRNQKDTLSLQMSDLQKREAVLDANKEYYKSKENLDRLARLQLNYKKPDENVVFVYERGGASSPSPTPIVKREKNWLEWLVEKLGI